MFESEAGFFRFEIGVDGGETPITTTGGTYDVLVTSTQAARIDVVIDPSVLEPHAEERTGEMRLVVTATVDGSVTAAAQRSAGGANTAPAQSAQTRTSLAITPLQPRYAAAAAAIPA
ncbi:hypothetical protein ET445_09425 [Agromyces protaetiae]|uniref:Uncharacterized protein n=1 Tax=Agromyces protaetiae TaxID=2509455 RepID=A0A4P6FCJ0_9MICO|nr:hypothetical protein [Agromyces protaetiae]QAY73525.1 hypothetical protein ET445_09425 [Agromyces protaetiae]